MHALALAFATMAALTTGELSDVHQSKVKSLDAGLTMNQLFSSASKDQGHWQEHTYTFGDENFSVALPGTPEMLITEELLCAYAASEVEERVYVVIASKRTEDMPSIQEQYSACIEHFHAHPDSILDVDMVTRNDQIFLKLILQSSADAAPGFTTVVTTFSEKNSYVFMILSLENDHTAAEPLLNSFMVLD